MRKRIYTKFLKKRNKKILLRKLIIWVLIIKHTFLPDHGNNQYELELKREDFFS